MVIPESEADPNNKVPVTSPYTTLDPPPPSEPEQAVYVWSLRDLKFGNILSVETTKKEWKTIINKYLIEDETNSIMLIPEENVIISNLEVA